MLVCQGKKVKKIQGTVCGDNDMKDQVQKRIDSRKKDGRSNADVPGKVLQTPWMHGNTLEDFVLDMTRGQSVLNYGCGSSMIGHPRVDIDADTTRTMEGDVFESLDIFRQNQFDFVFSDMPFDLLNPNSTLIKQYAIKLGLVPELQYNDRIFRLIQQKQQLRELEKEIDLLNFEYRHRFGGQLAFKWQFDLFKIAKKGLITRRNLININLPSRYHEYYVIEDHRPQLNLLRIDYK